MGDKMVKYDKLGNQGKNKNGGKKR